jgi:fumarate reductase subunit C
MSDRPTYTPFHPRWYRPRISTWWWLKRRSSRVFILREVSSIFVAWFVVFFLLLVAAVGRGEAAYQEFMRWAANPGIVLVNVVSLFFVVFHAVTWFNLAPQAMVVHMRGKRVPGKLIAASNYGAWVVTSFLVAWIILAGSS